MHSFAKWENTELIFWWTEVLIQICFVQRWRTEQTIFPCHFAMPQSVMKALDPFYAKAPFLSPPENVSKLEVFWRFQGVLKCSMDLNGLKTYTRALTSSKRFLKTFFNFIYLRFFFFCNFVPVEERINGIIRKTSVSQLSSNKRERHWRKLSWGINWFD